MIHTVLAAVLLLHSPVQDVQEPSEEEVQAAVEALEAAFKEKEVAARVSGLQLASALAAEEVAETLARKGLKDPQIEVRRAVVGSLGLMDHPEALKQLHSYAKRDRRKLAKDTETQVIVIKAIGRHRSESSLKVLTEGVFSSPARSVVQARILALGMVRSPKAVDELMSMMRLVDRRKIQNRMEDFRLSLMVLTGVDHGKNQDRWSAWWNDNKKAIKVKPKAPMMPKVQQNRWDRYWDNPRTYERQKRRGERGDDPEDDG